MGLLSSQPGFSVSKLLYPKLKKEIQKLRAEGEVTRKSVLNSGLGKVIKDELNLTCSPTLDVGLTENAYAQLPMFNEDHPFLKRYQTAVASGDAIALIKKLGRPIYGGFDNQGKAFGDIADIPITIAIGKGLFSDKFTDGEITMILLHEIGHARTQFSFLIYGFTTSTLAHTATHALINERNREERMRLVLEYENAVGTTIQSKEKLVDSNDEQLITTVVVAAADNVKSDMNTPSFDVSQCEQSADQFATAAGNGAELASGVGKITGRLDPSRISRPVYYTLDAVYSLLIMSQFLNPIGAVIMSLRLLYKGNPSAVAYNDTEERFTRIRRAMVIESKSSKLTQAERVRLSEHLKTIDDLIDLYVDRRSFYQLLFTVVHPAGRREKKRTDAVRLYEELMANELHVANNKLKSL